MCFFTIPNTSEYFRIKFFLFQISGKPCCKVPAMDCQRILVACHHQLSPVSRSSHLHSGGPLRGSTHMIPRRHWSPRQQLWDGSCLGLPFLPASPRPATPCLLSCMLPACFRLPSAPYPPGFTYALPLIDTCVSEGSTAPAMPHPFHQSFLYKSICRWRQDSQDQHLAQGLVALDHLPEQPLALAVLG